MPFLVAGLVILCGLVLSQSSGQSLQSTVLLHQGAAIAGRILDASAEPVADARVMALQQGPLMPDGSRPLFAWAEHRTNQLGEFRVAGLPPGEYFVYGVAPRQPQSATSTTPTVVLAPTFFPGTLDQSRAVSVTVADDRTANDVVFRLESVPAYHVSGIVVDETAAPVRGAMVALDFGPGMQRSFAVTTKSAGFVPNAGEARSDQDGRFMIGSVTAGSYILTAPLPGGLPGRVVVTVDRADVADVRMVVRRQR